ncbi:MAG: hypothetical protein K2F89_06305 [Treponemataceae bacterium]|nr:hypothetical protein [Treponemataceae bacterium]
MKTPFDKITNEVLRSLSEEQIKTLFNALDAQEKNIKPVPFPTSQKDITLKKVMPIVINEILEGRDITCDYKIGSERFYSKLKSIQISNGKYKIIAEEYSIEFSARSVEIEEITSPDDNEPFLTLLGDFKIVCGKEKINLKNDNFFFLFN